VTAPGEDAQMAILTDDMKRVIREQRLGFYATVCEDGSPNLSPKGTTFVLDDDHLFFADVRSPQTVANIRRGSLVEVNVLDPVARTGYRFKGPAAIHEAGTSRFAEGVERLRETGSPLADRVRAIVVVDVCEARPLASPVQDDAPAPAPVGVPPAKRAPIPAPPVESPFRAGDRVRFPDPLRNEQMTTGTFVAVAVGEPIEVPSRVGGVPPRLVESAWVRHEDGTTARVIHGWIRPAEDASP
jgi:predicted pyridoxine 5'-phosphate oxidase superfamily flavin-nucleotide-binding protein